MKMIPGKMYYVDNVSDKGAIENMVAWEYVYTDYNYSMWFRGPWDGENLCSWKYAVPVEEDQEMDGLKEGDEVYVSDESIEDAFRRKKYVYITQLKNGMHLCSPDMFDDNRLRDMAIFATAWKYVVPVPKQTELTMAQIAEKFGVPVEQLRIKE